MKAYKLIGIAAGFFAAGMLVEYFWDPERGRNRRKETRDRFRKAKKELNEFAEHTAHEFKEKAHVMTAKAGLAR